MVIRHLWFNKPFGYRTFSSLTEWPFSLQTIQLSDMFPPFGYRTRPVTECLPYLFFSCYNKMLFIICLQLRQTVIHQWNKLETDLEIWWIWKKTSIHFVSPCFFLVWATLAQTILGNENTVGIWNPDYSGFWMVQKRLGCKWSVGFKWDVKSGNPTICY